MLPMHHEYPAIGKKFLGFILLVKLIFEKSLLTYRLQYFEISDSLLIKKYPFFLCFMFLFSALEFNIKVITFKNCALDHRNYANIKKLWDFKTQWKICLVHKKGNIQKGCR